MKSLKRNFKQISEKNPHWSSYVCFAETTRKQRFNKRTIREWFEKLVDKDDYDENEKKELTQYLSKVSNAAEDNQK